MSSRVSHLLTLHNEIVPNNRVTRGHRLKLFKKRARLDIRKYSFPFRITETWNSLPDQVVAAPSTKSFEKRLDKFWQDQNLVYDFSASITKLKPESGKDYYLENTDEDNADLRIEVLP